MQKLSSIQALRGVAAVFVLLYHTTSIYVTNGLPAPYFGLFKQGDKGVDLFFVLSGFIMVYVHRRDMGASQRYLPYLYTRLIRIYPIMWIVSAMAIAIYAAHFSNVKLGKLHPADLVYSLLLLPQPGVPLVNVTWTLVYEVFFYVVFGLAILNRRVGLIVLAIWQLVILAVLLARIDTDAPAMLPFRSIALEFGLGMTVGWLITSTPPTLTRATRIAAQGSVMLGAILTVLSASVLGHAPRFATFGVASALLVYGLSTLERGGLVRAPKPLEQVGDASYAIYLIHFSVITLVVGALARIHAREVALILAPLVSVIGLVVGEGLYLLIDKPLGRALRNPFRPRPKKPLPTSQRVDASIH